MISVTPANRNLGIRCLNVFGAEALYELKAKVMETTPFVHPDLAEYGDEDKGVPKPLMDRGRPCLCRF